MLRIFYRWRYYRAQKSDSFEVPSDRDGYGNGQVNLGSYMSQASVRGRTFDRFDLPRKRRQGLAFILTIVVAVLAAWLVIESIAALELLSK